ncbi:deoxyribodipyrimidine photo-lyase [uncultured Tateyamaria sp.]|uniref:cryptochrome/photolyase family protein n=1 Tax=Tateyamaria sp. 1078 TaxID=3417464 RepID=UPI00262DA19F|nr:deoxyribodipyrimidine photo-lyase [uncultured Tateyamaria sp.]
MWFRRDLRLSDHTAFAAACKTGRPVIPVVIRDDSINDLGAAPKWRWGLGAAHVAQSLEAKGSRLICRSGDALTVLQALIKDTGAGAVYWSRLYDPQAVVRDTQIKARLKEADIDARSYGGHLMFEPWTTETKTGGFYKVYTPFWRAVKDRDVDVPLPTPGKVPTPETWPGSEDIMDWDLGRDMRRGAEIVRPFVRLGEDAARDRLGYFTDELIAGYDAGRDLPAADRTSNLSENLALGEISPHQCWHAGFAALQEGKAGAETFLKELVWREFAYHLMHHTPHILADNWKPDWDAFPWNTDEDTEEVTAWKQGRTGIQFVDASLREMYVTGRMHNRGRMIVASYLTKHLLTDWRIGQKWFEDCLIDWDPASNAMGWQWSAGSGPDATPYFRVFNPVTQLDKFDKNRAYVSRWIAEGRSNPHEDALDYFDAIPRAWGLSPSDTYPAPIVAADEGRKRALSAYENRDF